MTAVRLAPLALFLTLPIFAVEPLKIQDNSFLIEEAYNQEPGVIQYITTLSSEDGVLFGTFTNEIPAGGQLHQFSYTLSGLRLDGRSGFGDTLINYRYQLAGDGNARIAIAPRISLLVPTGSKRRGFGDGSWGYELNLPLSVAIHDRLVMHGNAGTTQASDRTWFIGGSVIAAPYEKFHVMLETRWSRGGDDDFIVSPGIRWAWDLANGFQVVPGIAAPIGRDTKSLFFYLSLER